MLAKVLERGEQSGEFRRGIDPMQLYISIAGLAYFYLSNNHTLSTIFGRDLMTPAPTPLASTHQCGDRRLRRRPGGTDGTPRRASIRLSPDNALRRQR